ncbi:peptidyl-prolyl cis-trans isomerase [Pseudoalteromonas rubra]|uniref:Peptidyl-prolyl cis-trans isomerase n=1 Tax=Pseudoalteromonas rubra TaxID=43658 RepID=A0A5S3WRG1_9GAMM|nr:peptidylprolyl isomerase [Pseudoalteromonas rubra]TMP30323.1 peptidyl-prolyl cis-trans isomerase [Pseudoalteromonas rubra]TMP35346.1 peptidyl-prolyl cis-trans isomerase [Pseudoalteromonas rubra]
MNYLVLLLAGCLSLPCWATLTQLTKPELVLMQSLYTQQDRDLSSAELNKHLLENQFLLATAQQLNPELMIRQSGVGFDNDYHIRRLIVTLLTHQFPELKSITKEKSIAPFSAQALSKLLGDYPANGNYQTRQLEQWQQIRLLDTPKVTLADLLISQSMQNRFRLHQGDIDLLVHQLDEWRYYANLTDRAAPLLAKHGLSLSRLELLAKGELLRPPMLAFLGIKAQLHGERSTYLEQLRATISQAEIHRYYKQHRKDFRYKSTLEAQAATFESQTQAQHFHRLMNKKGMKQALKETQKHNEFDSAGKTTPVSITREHQKRWLAQLAFSSQSGKATPPVRTPSGRWAVVYTQHPKYAYYSEDSETVRYQALDALTKQRAQAAYQQKFRHWQTQHGVPL